MGFFAYQISLFILQFLFLLMLLLPLRMEHHLFVVCP
jgi:hypothetical protein